VFWFCLMLWWVYHVASSSFPHAAVTGTPLIPSNAPTLIPVFVLLVFRGAQFMKSFFCFCRRDKLTGSSLLASPCDRLIPKRFLSISALRPQLTLFFFPLRLSGDLQRRLKKCDCSLSYRAAGSIPSPSPIRGRLSRASGGSGLTFHGVA